MDGSMSDKLVSVIIPAYNAAGYVADTIDSVLKQTHVNLEVVVVDDGSTDNTADVVKGITDKRLKYIYQKNASQAVARNNGIENSDGDFLAFIDSDDLWAEQKIEKQLALFENPSVGAAYTAFERIDENGKFLKSSDINTFRRGKVLPSLISSNFVTCSSVMVRRSVLDQHQLRFRTGRKGVEDYDLWLRVAAFCEFDYCPDALLKYREHGGGTSRDMDLMYASATRTLDDLEEFLFHQEKITEYDAAELKRACNKGRANQMVGYANWLLLHGRRAVAKKVMRDALKVDLFNLFVWKVLIRAFLFPAAAK